MPISRIDNEGLTGPIGGRRNIVINGAMQVAQRGTSETSSASSLRLVDRFRSTNSGGQSLTYSQESDAPDGFANSLKIKVASTFSTGATDQLGIGQLFEGQDVQHLKKGTSGALPVTLSFYIKSNLTGNVVVELLDRDSAFRHIEALVNISSANTWEYKTVTFAGDTSGVLDNDNNASFDFHIYFGAGSNYTSGTLATSWATFSAANRLVGLDLGGNNFGSSTDNFISITGVQLEVGSVATEFEHRSFGEELALCQRYYQSIDTNSRTQTIGFGHRQTTNTVRFSIPTPVALRAAPSITISGTVNCQESDGTATATTSISGLYNSNGYVVATGTASGVVNGSITMQGHSGTVQIDAEL